MQNHQEHLEPLGGIIANTDRLENIATVPEIGGRTDYLLRGMTPSPTFRSIDRENQSISQHLEQLSVTSPEYFNLLKELAGNVPSMHRDCKVSVNIPAYNEERVIERALNTYRNQDTSGVHYEVNLFVNSRRDHPSDDTANIARQFAERYKTEVTVNVFEAMLEKKDTNVGFARKVLVDLALMRSTAREEQSSPLFIQHDDADIYGVSEDHLCRVIQAFEGDPSIDITIRKLRPDKSYTDTHEGFAWERALDLGTYLCFFRKVRSKISHEIDPDIGFTKAQSMLRPIGTGCSSAVSAEAHALLKGGFGSVSHAEDLQLGLSLAILRGEVLDNGRIKANYENIKQLNSKGIWDPRRSARNLYRSVKSSDFQRYHYSDYAELETIDEVRNISPRQYLDSDVLAPYADFSKLARGDTEQFILGLISFHERNIRNIIASSSELDDTLLKDYATFISTYLLRVPGGVRYENGKFHLKELVSKSDRELFL